MSAGKRLRRSLRYILLRGLLWPLEILPRSWALVVGDGLGRLAWWGLPDLRCLAETNIERAGLATSQGAREMGRQCFRTLGRNAIDFLRLPRFDEPCLRNLVTVDGEDHLLRAYHRGAGVVVATGHIGNWELLASYFARRGFPVYVIARRLREERFDRFVASRRLGSGVRCLSRDLTLIRAVRVLERGGLLGILCDQNTLGGGFDLPFFGRTAFTPVGAAALCRLSRASLVPAAIHLQQDGGHRITVLPELKVPRTEDRDRDLRETMLLINGALEDLIRRAPEQWVWFHERWGKKKTRSKARRRGSRHDILPRWLQRAAAGEIGADGPGYGPDPELSESRVAGDE